MLLSALDGAHKIGGFSGVKGAGLVELEVVRKRPGGFVDRLPRTRGVALPVHLFGGHEGRFDGLEIFENFFNQCLFLWGCPLRRRQKAPGFLRNAAEVFLRQQLLEFQQRLGHFDRPG